MRLVLRARAAAEELGQLLLRIREPHSRRVGLREVDHRQPARRPLLHRQRQPVLRVLPGEAAGEAEGRHGERVYKARPCQTYLKLKKTKLKLQGSLWTPACTMCPRA